MRREVDGFIDAHDEEVQALLEATRRYLHETAPGLTEAMKWRRPTFMQERNRFTLDAEADHVVLGFTDGARLEEHRAVFDAVHAEAAHVRIRSVDDLTRPGLREAVRAAAGFRA